MFVETLINRNVCPLQILLGGHLPLEEIISRYPYGIYMDTDMDGLVADRVILNVQYKWFKLGDYRYLGPGMGNAIEWPGHLHDEWPGYGLVDRVTVLSLGEKIKDPIFTNLGKV